MSGVLIDGTQYERCNACGSWTPLRCLGYEYPTPAYPHGRDLCNACVDALIASGDAEQVPHTGES